MSIFKKIFKRGLANSSLSDIDKAVSAVLAGANGEQVYVTEDTALTVATVWACVSLLSESVGILPIHLYKKTEQGRESVSKHPGLSVINKPNSYTKKLDLMQHLMVSVTLNGNGYAQIIRDDNARPVKIKLLQPDVPFPILTDDDELMYNVKGQMVSSDDMIHIKGLVVDGLVGKSPIAVHRENIALTMMVQKYGQQFFSKGGNTSGMFEIPGTLSDDAFARLKQQIYAGFSGISNSHKPLILEGGMKYSRINIPLDDAQFLSTRKFQKGEIASIFRIPPHMVGDLERATYSNIEQQAQEFVTYCLLPYLEKIEEELNDKLLAYSEQDTYYFKFVLNGLLRADSKSRSEYYKNMYIIGCMNSNEIRELEEMNKYDGGDKFFVQQNMTTTDNAINQNNGQEGNS